MRWVRFCRRSLAEAFGRYPSSPAAERIRSRDAALGPGTPRNTKDTSWRDTPTWFAMSAIVAMRPEPTRPRPDPVLMLRSWHEHADAGSRPGAHPGAVASLGWTNRYAHPTLQGRSLQVSDFTSIR